MKRCLEIKKSGTESITIEEVNKSIVNIVCESWEKLCHDLKSGDITFQEFGNHFSDMKKKVVNKELNFIADKVLSSDSKKEWIEQRLYQFEQYKVLKESVNGAKVLTEFAKQFDLNGNFEQVQKMMKLVCIIFLKILLKVIVSNRIYFQKNNNNQCLCLDNLKKFNGIHVHTSNNLRFYEQIVHHVKSI